MELEEAVDIVKKLNNGYSLTDCEVCGNYNELTGICDKEKCDELIAIETVLQELDRLQKENERYENKIILSDEEYRRVIDEAQKDCVFKDKIKELISKVDVDIERNDRRMIMYKEEIGTSEYVCKMIAYDPRSIKNILQDLLKEE